MMTWRGCSEVELASAVRALHCASVARIELGTSGHVIRVQSASTCTPGDVKAWNRAGATWQSIKVLMSRMPARVGLTCGCGAGTDEGGHTGCRATRGVGGACACAVLQQQRDTLAPTCAHFSCSMDAPRPNPPQPPASAPCTAGCEHVSHAHATHAADGALDVRVGAAAQQRLQLGRLAVEGGVHQRRQPILPASRANACTPAHRPGLVQRRLRSGGSCEYTK